MAGKTKAQLEAENKILRRYRRIESIVTIIRDVLRYGTLSWLGYCAYLTMGILAGKTTQAHVLVNLLADMRINAALGWCFGAAGVGYGWRQRRLRRDTVEQVSAHNARLEQSLDPSRSTSRLTTRGDTQPEDMP